MCCPRPPPVRTAKSQTHARPRSHGSYIGASHAPIYGRAHAHEHARASIMAGTETHGQATEGRWHQVKVMTSCSSSCCRERDAAQGRLGLAPDPARAAPMHAYQHALPNLGPTSHRVAFLLKVPRIRPPRIGPPQIGPPQTGPPRTDPQRTGLPRTGLPRFGRSQRIAMDRSGRVAADRKRVANEPQRIGADRNGSERVANGPQTGRKRAAALKTGRK